MNPLNRRRVTIAALLLVLVAAVIWLARNSAEEAVPTRESLAAPAPGLAPDR